MAVRPESARTPVSSGLFLGFAVASIGGPLALLTLFPGTAGDGIDSAGLVVLLGLLVFGAPLGIWLAFSGRSPRVAGSAPSSKLR